MLRRLCVLPCVAVLLVLTVASPAAGQVSPPGPTPDPALAPVWEPLARAYASAVEAPVPAPFKHVAYVSAEGDWAEQLAVGVAVWNSGESGRQAAMRAAIEAEAREAAEAAARRSQPRGSRVPQPSGGGTFAGNSTGTVNGYPCGGDLPTCEILRRESGGNPKAENPSSSASGLWQHIDSSWNNFGGYAHASDAPPEVQNEKARQMWAGGAGCSHWSQTASGC